MKTKRRLFFLTALIGIITFSCKKETNTPPDDDLSLVTDVHRLEDESNRVFYWAEHAFQYNKVQNSIFPSCATLTFDTMSTSKSITIDFGSSAAGCKCTALDAYYRKGVLTITWEGDVNTPGTVRTITSTNYYRGNGNQSNKVEVNMKLTTVSSTEFTSEETVSYFVTPNDKVSRTATKSYKWRQGKTTFNELFDDLIWISGTGNGTDKSGKSFTTSTVPSEAINLETACKWLSQGIVNIDPSGGNPRKVEYGTCDAYAGVNIQGRVYSLNMLSE